MRVSKKYYGNRKPTAVFDDNSYVATAISSIIRVIAGVEVVHFRAIEQFEEHYKLDKIDTLKERPDGSKTFDYANYVNGLAKVLKLFSAISFDNNYSTANSAREGYPYITGMIRKALKSLSETERPIILLSSSNWCLIEKEGAKLWDEMKVLSINSIQETALIGLALRMAIETGRLLSREELLVDLLGFENARYDYGASHVIPLSLIEKTISDLFNNEASSCVEGASRKMPLDSIARIFETNITHLQEGDFLTN